MASSPARGYLTEWLKSLLETEGLLVGLVVAPLAGGWNDDPNQVGNYFTQYVVLTPLPGSEPEGSIADPGTEWNLPYSIAAYGILDAQVESQADSARRIVNEIKRVSVSLDGIGWRVMDSKTNSIGGVEISHNTTPPELSQRDVVMIRISKERS